VEEQEHLKALRIREVLRREETADLRESLKMDTFTAERYAMWCVSVEETVGLQRVKEFLVETLADAKGKKQDGSPFYPRHILMAGLTGTGKYTAAQLVARLGKILGWVDNQCLSDLKPGFGGKSSFGHKANEEPPTKKKARSGTRRTSSSSWSIGQLFDDPLSVDVELDIQGTTQSKHQFVDDGDHEVDSTKSHGEWASVW
jgi:hypothetical protein